MKRFLATILLICLLLPTPALAESADPVAETESRFETLFTDYYTLLATSEDINSDPRAAHGLFPFQATSGLADDENAVMRKLQTEDNAFGLTVLIDQRDGSIINGIILVTLFSTNEQVVSNAMIMLGVSICTLYSLAEGGDNRLEGLKKGGEAFSALASGIEGTEKVFSDDLYSFSFVQTDLAWVVSFSSTKAQQTAAEPAPEDPTASEPGEAPASRPVTLSVGSYDCPAHIPAGEYKVTPQKGGTLLVTRGETEIISETLNPADGDEIDRLVLQDGDVIKLSGGARLDFAPLP